MGKSKRTLGIITLCFLLAFCGCADKRETGSETRPEASVTGGAGEGQNVSEAAAGAAQTPTGNAPQELTIGVSPEQSPTAGEPTGTTEPTDAAEPTETPEPTITAAPTGDRKPTATPKPAVTAAPQKPTATPKPSRPTEGQKPTSTSTPIPTQSVKLGTSLYKRYEGYFYFGTCVNASYLNNSKVTELVLEQFNSITCENEMKPDALLNQYQCQAQGKVVITVPSNTKKILDWAKKNGLKVRGHVLVWYSQTPDWFFREGFRSNGALVSREEMLSRMESYIKQVLNYCDTNYPGMFYAWDVVNEAFTDDGTGYRDCNWYKILGEDYITEAFRFARKYASAGTKLFYNDFNTYINYSDKLKTTRICNLVKELKKENLIDGVGMQAHLDVSYPSADDFVRTVTTFSNLGVEVQITELDVTTTANASGWKQQADYLDRIFSALEKNDRTGVCNLTSVSVWGIADNYSWRASQDPLLFDDNLKPKAAYYSVLQQ